MVNFGIGPGRGNALSGTGITAADVAEFESSLDPMAGYNSEYVNQLNRFKQVEQNKLYSFFNSPQWNKGAGSYNEFSTNWDLKNVANRRKQIGTKCRFNR